MDDWRLTTTCGLAAAVGLALLLIAIVWAVML